MSKRLSRPAPSSLVGGHRRSFYNAAAFASAVVVVLIALTYAPDRPALLQAQDRLPPFESETEMGDGIAGQPAAPGDIPPPDQAPSELSYQMNSTEGWKPKRSEANESSGWHTPSTGGDRNTPPISDKRETAAEAKTASGWRPRALPKKVVLPLDAKQRPPLLQVQGAAEELAPPLKIELLPEPDKNADKIPTLPKPLTLPEPPLEKSPDPRAAVLLSAARNAVARGQLNEAVGRFEEYLKLFPNDREARREYAGLLVQVERVKLAIEQFKSLLADDAENVSLLIALGDAHMQIKEFAKASAYLSQALEHSPENLDLAVKLAQSFAFAGDFARAYQVFDRYLNRLTPDDPRTPKTLAALLIDLGRPEEAIAFLQPVRERSADDLEVLANLIRAYARLGNRLKTQELIADLSTRKPGSTATRLELAEALYQAGDLDFSAAVYGQVLQVDSANVVAQLGLARVYIGLFQPREAGRILSGVKPTATTQRSYLLAWSEFHQLVGEYIQAKQIYRSFLERDDRDQEARLALAKLYEFVREDEKAKAEYAKIAVDASEYRSARFGLISTLTTQRHFLEAIELARQMLRETNASPTARAALARVLAKSKAFAEAEAICKEYLRQETRNEAGIAELRQMLGRIFLDQGKMAEALTEFEAAMSRPSGRTATSFYGIARARLALGPPEQAAAVFEAASAFLGEIRGRLLLADQFITDLDDNTAIELCVVALKPDPTNLAVLIRLVDIRQRQAVASGKDEETIAVGEQIFRQSPYNVRGLLAVARAYAIAQKYKKSVELYEKLIVAEPQFLVARREQARVFYSDHAYNTAAGAYKAMTVPPAIEPPKLPGIMDPAGITTPSGQASPSESPFLEQSGGPRMAFDILHNEIIKPATTPGEIDSRAGIPGSYYDNIARTAEILGADLEGRAKSLKGWRNYASIPVYKELVQAVPTNTEALFDLGQVYAATVQTHKEIATYGELLNVDPKNRSGTIAMERASLELQPQLLMNFDFFGERGRNGLAAIDRYKYTTAARLPYGDENEFVQFGFTRAEYNPVGADPIYGNIIFVRDQQKVLTNLLLYGQANLELFNAGFRDRVTFDTGVQYEPSDLVRLFFSGFLENVAETAGSLAQDIHRGGVRFGGDVRPARCWDFGGNYRIAAYSDKNALNEFNLFNEVLLSYAPRQLKWVTTLNYESFEHPSVFDPNQPTNTVLVVHPYFSPTNFSYYETRLEWTQYLSRDYFAHANVCYYSAQVGTGWDNNFNNYGHFRLLFNYDIAPWCSVGADSNYTVSKVYRSVAAYAYLILRLPHFDR